MAALVRLIIKTMLIMGYIIEISESKADKLKEHAYKSMKHLGKLYECIEEICDDGSMGERDGGGYGNRYGSRYGNRGGGSSSSGSGSMGYRDEDDWEREPEMGFRRGVPGTGRYSRFR